MQMCARRQFAEKFQGVERLQRVDSGKLMLHTAARLVCNRQLKCTAPDREAMCLRNSSGSNSSQPVLRLCAIDVAEVIEVSPGLEYQRLHNKTP